jgi:glycosyltransferase involved in cell wall biosynthesis
MTVADPSAPAPLRIALVTHYFPSHRGGVEVVAGEIAARLARSGAAEITWHASDTDSPPDGVPGLTCVPACAWNFTERRLGLPFPIWGPSALARLARTVRAADVVHLHDFLYLPNVVAWACACLARRPVLVTQHVGMIPYRSQALRALLSLANRVLGRLLLGNAARTAFVSEVVLEYFSGFVRFRAAPLRVANGVDTDLFIPPGAAQRAALRARLGVRDARPLLLFAGRFVEKKGLALLHRLAERMPDVDWLFAGWGPLDPGAWGLAHVRVERNLGREELALRYQAADLLVLPSVGEGFPLVVQEAMACGTPSLVSTETAAGCPEACDVLPAEPLGEGAEERWQARIETLLAGPKEDFRAQVAAFAAVQWSWDRCARRYAELLRDCVS